MPKDSVPTTNVVGWILVSVTNHSTRGYLKKIKYLAYVK